MRKLHLITIVFILLATIWLQFFVKGWKQNRIIDWDTMIYYSYLPATFIHNDITFEFAKTDIEKYSRRFWAIRSQGGGLVVKMSMGMAFIYSPFFFIAHSVAKPLGYEADGYSLPYQMAIAFGAILYFAVGLFLLAKLLRKYFSPVAVSLTLLLVALGTNLWYYSAIEPGMTHVYNFTFFILFILTLNSWLKSPKVKLSIGLGLLCGIISLIRPSNTLIGLLFLLWGISSWDEFKERILLLLRRWDRLLIVALFAIAVWMPQIIYWKVQTGQFFYYTYGEQGFFFANPHIIDGLFSFRKGWFIYTPIMLFAVAGIFYLPRYIKGLTLGISVFLVLNVYIIFSWWSWWYGGSFGARPMIDSYGILAIPLAAMIEQMLGMRKWIKISAISIMLVLFLHGVFQTFQYYYGSIHWDSMTKEAYFLSFGRMKQHPELPLFLKMTDYDRAIKGEYVYKPHIKGVKTLVECDLETVNSDSTAYKTSMDGVEWGNFYWRYKDDSKSGKYSFYAGKENNTGFNAFVVVKPNHFYLIEVWKKGRSKDVFLVVQSKEPHTFYKSSRYVTERGAKGWKKMAISFTTPKELPNDTLELFVYNHSNSTVLLDDMVVYEEIKE